MSTTGKLLEAIQMLKSDLLGEEGPQLSTMRNYRFGILCYSPREELRLRQEISALSAALTTQGWVVLPISLQELLLKRVLALGDETLSRMIERERRTAERSPERALHYLQSKLAPLIEGPEGIAKDVCDQILRFKEAHPDKSERTLAFIGRAGALYPFFRSSALLKHIDGRTGNVPVVLLYPGERRGVSGLSFMGELAPDKDYRPRIYG